MSTFTITVAAFYHDIKIEADDEEEAKEIAMLTIQDRWRDYVIAAVTGVEHGDE
jgi:hypothetical protein